eukprot:CAMPEP_0174351934 /NCGR_PEP_ID=MMETSP0811_2-20130205/9454_1 /TAXON_ID=73025 ORGANISM="Eutreptiella gymnastica-like, Strain CCMP1594" /NCGR_SAMPLE_ID=MMETSP0811_2 /ASSEMBLY_ACC=CAM_ASM_000667 /LENGTH=143 /DNA_ID=CAMNT_0015481647 /DNA_START=475 /DNA_END=904 /DNA_ORIENTATION=+
MPGRDVRYCTGGPWYVQEHTLPHPPVQATAKTQTVTGTLRVLPMHRAAHIPHVDLPPRHGALVRRGAANMQMPPYPRQLTDTDFDLTTHLPGATQDKNTVGGGYPTALGACPTAVGGHQRWRGQPTAGGGSQMAVGGEPTAVA